MKKHITILGGGIAGLAAGYFARKHGFPFTIHEASGRCGGSAATIRRGDFFFDTGAHRFHARYADITRELLGLMGDNLQQIKVPSQIYSRGKRFDFPLKPLNLFLKLGPLATAKAGFDFLAARSTSNQRGSNFETFAVSSYGRYIAERFLLGYSQKLWGAPPCLLAPEIAGKRLQGLNLHTFMLEAFLGKWAATEHLDGAFYYPQKNGIGAIAESLEDYCGRKTIRLHSEVTRVFQHAGNIRGIELNGCDRVEVEEVISSIPITTLLSRLEPPPPDIILEATRRLRFRNLILVVLFLNRPRVTQNASIYFPDPEFPFTRVYEPKNRSLSMSPAGQTSLVAEIPSQPTDLLWQKTDSELLEAVRSPLCRSGFLHESDITDAAVVRLASAYPIIEKTSVKERLQVHHYLEGFSNLSLTGRNGLFLYKHIHDQMKQGKEIIERFMNAANQRSAAPVGTQGDLANKIY